MVAEKSLLFPSLPSATLISRLNKSFDGILCLWPFDVVPAASNTGSIQTAPSWKGWNSTIAGALNGGGAAWQCLAGPKMRTHRESFCSPALQWGSPRAVFPRVRDCRRARPAGAGCCGQCCCGHPPVSVGSPAGPPSVCRRVAVGRNNSNAHALAPGKWVVIWNWGLCLLCRTNRSSCKKKVEKVEVTAETRGPQSRATSALLCPRDCLLRWCLGDIWFLWVLL